MTENSSYDYIQGQDHLGHMTHDPSLDMACDNRHSLLKGRKFSTEIAIFLLINELWPKTGLRRSRV